jgi:ABC-type dipeptide/oligopeptide/nickel transport system permease component
MYKHVFRNTLIPVVTLFGVQFGYLLGGAFLVEVIFLWPGMGRYAVDAIGAFDYNSVIGVTLVVAIYFAIINFLLDLSYGYLSPQIRRK